MTVEQDGLDPAKVKAKHEPDHICTRYVLGSPILVWYVAPHEGQHCLPYRLAALALDREKERDDAQALAKHEHGRVLAYRRDYEQAQALALDLQGKVARVEALSPYWRRDSMGYYMCADELDAALADPTPAARCPQQTPFKALSEPTCTRPEGHEGAHLFTSYDGKTPLEMMPK